MRDSFNELVYECFFEWFIALGSVERCESLARQLKKSYERGNPRGTTDQAF